MRILGETFAKWTKKEPGEFPPDVLDYLHDILSTMEETRDDIKAIKDKLNA